MRLSFVGYVSAADIGLIITKTFNFP